MIYSMTGFGRCEIVDGARKVSVEVKSVNHRYLDISIKMPKKFNLFETKIRNELKKYAERGKVDIFITYEDMSDSCVSLKFNESLAAEYMEMYKKAGDMFNIPNDINTALLMRCPDVLTMAEAQPDEDELWEFLQKALDGALEQFKEARQREGEHLKGDLIAKLDGMLVNVDFIAKRSPQIIAEYKQRLLDKINEAALNVQLDENRLATEVTIFADKICVDEELVRLKSHINAVKDALNNGGAIGRRLDFLAQEMNREANTTLSKSNDLDVSNAAIELKTDIEKVREQIQNIE